MFSNFQLNTFNGIGLPRPEHQRLRTTCGRQRPTATSAARPAPAPARRRPGVTLAGVEVEASCLPGARPHVNRRLHLSPTPTIANDLVGREPARRSIRRAVPAAGRQSVQRAEIRRDRRRSTWTPQIGNSGLSAPGLCRCPPDRRITIPARTCSREGAGRPCRGQRPPRPARAASSAGRSSCGRRTCSTPNYQQVAFNTPFQGSNGSQRDVRRSAASPRATPDLLGLPRRAADLRHHRPLPLLERGTERPSPATAGAFSAFRPPRPARRPGRRP